MTTQRFDPETKVDIKSLTIRLPSSPTDNLDKTFLLRVMIVERIRSYMDGIDFQVLREEVLRKHIKVPPYYETEQQQKDYFESEAMEINSLYDRIETDPLFKEDYMSLKPYQGHKWELRATTEHAILLTIQV